MGDQNLTYNNSNFNNKNIEEIFLENFLFKNTFYNNPECIVVTAGDTGKILFANSKFTEYFGYTEEEALGKTSIELGIYKHNEERQKRYEKLLNEGVIDFDFIFSTKNNNLINLFGFTKVFRFNDKPYFVSYISSESQLLEEKNRIEKELFLTYQKYKTLFENSPETILILQSGHIKMANEAAVKLSGYPLEELYAIPFLDFVEDEFKELTFKMHKKQLSGEILQDKYTVKIKTKAGKYKWINISGVKIDWDGAPATLNYLIDITEQKELQEKIIKQNEDLLKSIEQKDKLFSIMTHDLKNPLHTIIALSDIVFNEDNEIDDDEKIELLLEIRNAAKSINRLFDDLLSLNKLNKKDLDYNFVSTNLSEIIYDSYSYCFNTAKDKNILFNFDIQENLFVIGDETLLKSLFRNLFTNAVKFSNKDGMIEVTSSLDEEGFVKVIIKDYGIGMPKDLADHLFDLGYKIKRIGTNNEPSNGLGLQIVKHIAELHKIDIKFETEVNKGTTFYLRFLNKNKE